MPGGEHARETTCATCQAVIPYPGRGRPRRYCTRCNREKVAARDRAYREANREKVAARKRAYREANREKVAARKRAYREANEANLTCRECGERLRHRSASGLCGFCAEDEPADDVEAARRLIVEIDQSFSREGTGWSPPSVLFDRRGRWKAGVWQNLPDKLIAGAQRLAGVALENGDAMDLIPRYDQPDAVIYCDPPYSGPNRIAPGRGYRHDDDGTLWARLVEVLSGIEYASVILSGYPCPEADDLGWREVPLKHNRTVQTRAGGKLRPAPERVWLSPNVPEPVPRLFD